MIAIALGCTFRSTKNIDKLNGFKSWSSIKHKMPVYCVQILFKLDIIRKIVKMQTAKILKPSIDGKIFWKNSSELNFSISD
jgi:hypothetical protein